MSYLVNAAEFKYSNYSYCFFTLSNSLLKEDVKKCASITAPANLSILVAESKILFV